MEEERRYLIRNIYQWRCTRCLQVHEYLTQRCFPMLFLRPQDLMLVKRWREQVGERTHDLNVDSLPVGTIEAVTAREAQAIARRLLARGDGPPVQRPTIFT